MNQRTKEFLEVVGLIVAISFLLLGILTSSANEALKYFAIIILILILIVTYIQIVIVKRIEALEEKK